MTDAYKSFVGNLEEKIQLGRPRAILKLLLSL
jgi:hypothetical protein